MKIFTVGCGRWGTFISWYLDSIGHDVTLYGREWDVAMQTLINTRTNGLVTLSDTMKLSTRLEDMCEADVVVISIGSQGLSAFMETVEALGLKNKTFVLCMKGIEIGTGKRLSEIVTEHLDDSCNVAVWIGPGHVQEFTKGRPNCMVIDSVSDSVKRTLVDAFSSNLIRFYYGTDLIGNEVGAAAKNVIGIAAGILDGLGLTSLKGALMARAPREISRLVECMGGDPVSVYGLCHLGDYEATVFSAHSHNRRFGECLVTGGEAGGLAEGYYTAKALVELGERYNIELPICRAVYSVLYLGADVKSEMDALFARSLKYEF
ncbi:MAG: glycerol-3-phosphate dehydrogenase [Clostridia bacterium]|nr:glycerol-3-phosphate dehydrogenase [Clostridia bacterium]